MTTPIDPLYRPHLSIDDSRGATWDSELEQTNAFVRDEIVSKINELVEAVNRLQRDLRNEIRYRNETS